MLINPYLNLKHNQLIHPFIIILIKNQPHQSHLYMVFLINLKFPYIPLFIHQLILLFIKLIHF